ILCESLIEMFFLTHPHEKDARIRCLKSVPDQNARLPRRALGTSPKRRTLYAPHTPQQHPARPGCDNMRAIMFSNTMRRSGRTARNCCAAFAHTGPLCVDTINWSWRLCCPIKPTALEPRIKDV